MPHIFNNAKTKRLRKYQKKKFKKKKSNICRKKTGGYCNLCFKTLYFGKEKNEGHSKEIILYKDKGAK